jgi:hypothetical protein
MGRFIIGLAAILVVAFNDAAAAQTRSSERTWTSERIRFAQENCISRNRGGDLCAEFAELLVTRTFWLGLPDESAANRWNWAREAYSGDRRPDRPEVRNRLGRFFAFDMRPPATLEDMATRYQRFRSCDRIYSAVVGATGSRIGDSLLAQAQSCATGFRTFALFGDDFAVASYAAQLCESAFNIEVAPAIWSTCEAAMRAVAPTIRSSRSPDGQGLLMAAILAESLCRTAPLSGSAANVRAAAMRCSDAVALYADGTFAARYLESRDVDGAARRMQLRGLGCAYFLNAQREAAGRLSGGNFIHEGAGANCAELARAQNAGGLRDKASALMDQICRDSVMSARDQREFDCDLFPELDQTRVAAARPLSRSGDWVIAQQAFESGERCYIYTGVRNASGEQVATLFIIRRPGLYGFDEYQLQFNEEDFAVRADRARGDLMIHVDAQYWYDLVNVIGNANYTLNWTSRASSVEQHFRQGRQASVQLRRDGQTTQYPISLTGSSAALDALHRNCPS